MTYTSQKLSKKLKEAKYWGYTHWAWVSLKGTKPVLRNGDYIYSIRMEQNGKSFKENFDSLEIIAPAYDLIWDICIKYAKEFFGEGKLAEVHIGRIFLSIRKGSKIENIEDYIWEYCLFNKK